MMMWKEQMKKLSMLFMVGSKVTTLLAVYGAFTKTDIWLAPTQWLLVGILLAVWAVYAKLQ